MYNTVNQITRWFFVLTREGLDPKLVYVKMFELSKKYNDLSGLGDVKFSKGIDTYTEMRTLLKGYLRNLLLVHNSSVHKVTYC